MSHEEGLRSNRKLWDAWTDIHVGSEFYDVNAFRAGACSLLPLEIDEVGPVAGLELAAHAVSFRNGHSLLGQTGCACHRCRFLLACHRSSQTACS